MQPETRERLDDLACATLLRDSSTHALASALALANLLQDDLFVDEQPVDGAEATLLLGFEPDEETLTRGLGLLQALAGEEFLDRPVHFMRACASVIEGDPFFYEEEGEDPTAAQAMWFIYQAELLTPDNILADVGPAIQKLLRHLEGAEAEDLEELQSFIEAEGVIPENHIAEDLHEWQKELAAQLAYLRVKGDWLEDPALAELVRQAQS
jgi:hypothetical protein